MRTERTRTYWRLYIGRVMVQINLYSSVKD